MARLRDTRTGVVVSVDDVTVSQLGKAYEPVKAEASRPKKAPAKKAAEKPSKS